MGIPSPFVGSPGWKACCRVQNLHNSGRTSLVLLFSSLWVTHLAGMRFDFIAVVPLLPSHCGFFFVCLRFWGWSGQGQVASLIAQLVKNPLQCRRPWFNSWVGRSPWRREQLPTPVFWCGEFRGLYSLWGHKELDMTERLSHHIFFFVCSTVLLLNVQQLIVILVLSQEEISACPSTLPSWRMMI